MRGYVVSQARMGNGISVFRVALMTLAIMTMTACGGKEKPAGQSMARVNGEDITVHQLNSELERVGNAQVSKKEVLDGLIARQLLVGQAEKNKTDRDPKVMQAIERSKEQILAQAYLQTKLNNVAKPSEAEIETFYEKNPQLFAQRKEFDTKELVIDTKDLTPELIKVMNTARTLDEVQTWLQANQVKFVPTQATRSTVELPVEVVKALNAMQPGQLFTVKQGEKSQLIALQGSKNNPLTLEVARPKIEQFLILQKSKEAADAEVQRLRASAKIEYLNNSDAPEVKAAEAPTKADDRNAKSTAPINDVERGVASLK